MRRLFRIPTLGLLCGAALSFPASAQLDTGHIATGVVSVSTSPVPIVAARFRTSVDITVDGAVKCYLGPAGVTTSTGFPLQAVAGATKSIPDSAAVYAVCASTVNVGYMEHY